MSSITSDISVSPQDLMTSNTTAQAVLGARATTGDGRVFRYVKAGGTALVPGKLQQGPAIVANHQNIAVQAAAAVGAKTVSVTLGATATTANQYAGGYLVINDVNGEGHTYGISSHPAHAGSGTLTLTLTDAVIVALTTSSEACLIANQYDGVIVHPTTQTGASLGVAIYPVAAGAYGWIQTRGPVSCLNGDANITVGAMLSPSGATAGAVKIGVLASGFVGNALQAGVDTEYRTIMLQLD